MLICEQLFGRRWLLIAGAVICFSGHLIAASAKGTSQLIAGLAVLGFGAGFSRGSQKSCVVTGY